LKFRNTHDVLDIPAVHQQHLNVSPRGLLPVKKRETSPASSLSPIDTQQVTSNTTTNSSIDDLPN